MLCSDGHNSGAGECSGSLAQLGTSFSSGAVSTSYKS